jgi:DNA-binding MarR family transcriptional regulator
MTNPEPDPTKEYSYDDIVIPALLRAARGAYGNVVRDRLLLGGYDDLPQNGPYILGGMANHGLTAGNLIRGLGITKQAASQLIDTLVIRGYVVRQVNPDDRRRMDIELTERGIDAAAAVREGVVAVDDELAERLSPEQIAALRLGLVELSKIRERQEDERRSGTPRD